jgi:hypothetical protein
MHGYQGLLLLGGYAAAVACLSLGVRWQDRAAAHQDPRRRTWARFSYAAAGLLASATTYYWFSLVWNPVVLALLVGGGSALLAWWIWWRGFAQLRWMDRLAAGGRAQYYHGRLHDRPAFGLLPGAGRARQPDDPGAGFEAAISLRTQGIDVLGVQYLHLQPPADQVEPWRGTLAKLSDLDGTFAMVQVRTPEIPTLIIRPRSGQERHESHGTDAGPINPLDDARYTRNMTGAIRPSKATETVAFDGEFGKWFQVQAADPQLAARALTPQVRRALLADPWFRLGDVVFSDGVVWTTRWGRLTETRLFDASRRLTALAALLPSGIWADDTFATALRAADTSAEGWGSDTARRPHRRTLVDAVNERRTIALRTPVSAGGLVTRLILALAIAGLGGYMATDAIFGWSEPAQAARDTLDAIALAVFGAGMVLLAYLMVRPLYATRRAAAAPRRSSRA